MYIDLTFEALGIDPRLRGVIYLPLSLSGELVVHHNPLGRCADTITSKGEFDQVAQMLAIHGYSTCVARIIDGREVYCVPYFAAPDGDGNRGCACWVVKFWRCDAWSRGPCIDIAINRAGVSQNDLIAIEPAEFGLFVSPIANAIDYLHDSKVAGRRLVSRFFKR